MHDTMKGKCRSVNRNCCLGIWNLYFVFQFPNCRARRVSWILHGDIWILKSVQVPKSAARRVIWNLDGPRRFLETVQVLPKSGRPPPSAWVTGGLLSNLGGFGGGGGVTGGGCNHRNRRGLRRGGAWYGAVVCHASWLVQAHTSDQGCKLAQGCETTQDADEGGSTRMTYR